MTEMERELAEAVDKSVLKGVGVIKPTLMGPNSGVNQIPTITGDIEALKRKLDMIAHGIVALKNQL